MVLDFGLLQSGLFPESEATGEGMGSSTTQTIIRQVLDGAFAGPYFQPRFDAGATAPMTGLVVFRKTAWVALNVANSRRTTDEGVTWANCTVDTANMKIGCECRADSTKGISFNTVARNGDYTTNSGDNWSAAVLPANLSGGMCCDFPTATVAVAGMEKGTAARSIIYSNDGGANWTLCASGPAVANGTYAISMFNGTTGYAVTNQGDIYKTTNSGVDWTDTTHNVSGTGAAPTAKTNTIFATSATTAVFIDFDGYVDYYDNTAGTITKVLALNLTNNDYCIGSNIVKTKNGNLYFFQQSYIVSGSYVVSYVRLYKSMDLGLTWGVSMLPTNNTGTTYGCDRNLCEYDDNKLVLNLGTGKYLLVDVTNDTTGAIG